MPESTPLFPDPDRRRFRLILVHDYPRGIHAHEIERAFESLGHEVFAVALGGEAADPDAGSGHLAAAYRYDLLVKRETHVKDIVAAAGGADLLLCFEHRDHAYLPLDIEDCEIPTLYVMSDEAVHADWQSPLFPLFDVGLTSVRAVQRSYGEMGRDNIRYWHCWAAPSFIRNTGEERTTDFAFVGDPHPVLQRDCGRVVERITHLAREGYRIELRSRAGLEDYGRALNQARTTYVGSAAERFGPQAFEAMAAGCLVIAHQPDDPEDPVAQAFEPGREVIYVKTPDQASAAVRRYARDDGARRAIAEAAERKVRAEFEYRHVAERFIREIAPGIPADYRDRRAERLRHAGDCPLARRLNRARLSLGVGNGSAAAAILDGGPTAERDPAWLNARGVVAACTNQRAEAATLLGDAVTLDPANPVHATNLVSLQAHRMLLGEETADPALCETVLELLDQTDPESTTIEGAAFWYPANHDRPRIEIARAFVSLPPGPERTRRLLEVMRFRLHSFAGAIQARLGRVDEAEAHLKQAAAILPDDGYTLAARGDISLAAGRKARAERAYRRASQLEPFFAEAQIKLAHCLVDGGRQRDAVAALERLLEFTPAMPPAERAEALAMLGIAASRTGALDRAREALRDSLALSPDQPQIRAFLARLPQPQAQPV